MVVIQYEVQYYKQNKTLMDFSLIACFQHSTSELDYQYPIIESSGLLVYIVFDFGIVIIGTGYY